MKISFPPYYKECLQLHLLFFFWLFLYKREHLWHPLNQYSYLFYLRCQKREATTTIELVLKDWFECGKNLKYVRSENQQSQVPKYQIQNPKSKVLFTYSCFPFIGKGKSYLGPNSCLVILP